MPTDIIRTRIIQEQLKQFANNTFVDLVKAVVDIERGIMAVGGELHADEETILLEDGSQQNNLWGINLYPDKTGEDFVEFDSMINLRPSQNNRSRGVDDPVIRKKIVAVVNTLIPS